jgi:5-dehydro-2-deoxygluconokinase
MPRGYDKPLYLQPFDHRASFETGMFGWKGDLTEAQTAEIAAAKRVIFDGFKAAVAAGVPKAKSGILVDEQFGAAILRDAKAEGFITACAAEKSGQAEFDFQYGEDFARHVETFDPTFCKVLVRYNPEGDATVNRRQTAQLGTLSRWLRKRDRKFLFELLVPATTAQLDRFEGHQRDYDKALRPSLVVEVITAMQAADVEPDIWKIEGLDDRAACEAVVAQARSGGRDGVKCIVLGRGADEAQVIEWVKTGAAVDGFDGFAVGRTLWQDALKDYLAEKLTRDQTVDQIARRYLEVIAAYRGAEPGGARG